MLMEKNFEIVTVPEICGDMSSYLWETVADNIKHLEGSLGKETHT